MAEDSLGVRHKWTPVVYANYYGILVAAGRRLGYAIAIHGSMGRDFDLIAIPWTDEAVSPDFLVHNLAHSIGAWIDEDPEMDVEIKPHGRLAYTIGTGGGGYIDLSIMPRID